MHPNATRSVDPHTRIGSRKICRNDWRVMDDREAAGEGQSARRAFRSQDGKQPSSSHRASRCWQMENGLFRGILSSRIANAGWNLKKSQTWPIK